MSKKLTQQQKDFHAKFGDPKTRTEKICSECKEKKSLSSFHRRKTSRDGHHSICIICAKTVRRENYIIRKLKKAEK